jgi:hypothetical protein
VLVCRLKVCAGTIWARTTKVPALAPVQSAEPFLAESLTKILSPFSTEFSTVVLKTFSRALLQEEKAAPRAALK